MHLGGGGRLDRGDHRHAPDRDVEQDLGAEPLDDLDHRVERQLGRVGLGGDVQILRANPERHVASGMAAEPVRHRRRHLEANAVADRPQPAILGFDADRREVHRRRADKPGDETVGRFVVQLHRVADLLHPAVAHHDDAVAQRHRLDLIVRHVNRRRAEPLVQLFQFDPHLHAQLGVEVRQRLVEQEDARMAHDRAAQGDALALTARQLARLAPEVFVNAEDLGGLVDPLMDFGLVEFPHLEAEGHVVVDAHMRIERVILEHHRDVAIHRRQIVDHLIVDQDAPGGDAFEPRDHAQRRRLAASRTGRPARQIPCRESRD